MSPGGLISGLAIKACLTREMRGAYLRCAGRWIKPDPESTTGRAFPDGGATPPMTRKSQYIASAALRSRANTL